MNYRKLKWISSFMSDEIGLNDGYYIVCHYILVDFPEINIYINANEETIIDVFLEKDLFN